MSVSAIHIPTGRGGSVVSTRNDEGVSGGNAVDYVVSVYGDATNSGGHENRESVSSDVPMIIESDGDGARPRRSGEIGDRTTVGDGGGGESGRSQCVQCINGVSVGATAGVVALVLAEQN